MPRKRRERSAAQIRQTEFMRKKRWGTPEEAEEMSEVYWCMTFEEYKDRMAKAEREVDQGHKELKNAERRFARMAEKVEATKHESEGLETELGQAKERLETTTAECAYWKDRTVELQRTLCQIKAREARGPKGISDAVRSAIAALAASGVPLSPPGQRVKGRVCELVNELAFVWRLPTPMIAGVIDSISRATVDVCYGGYVDDVGVDMGEHEGGPVTDGVPVAGPSNVVVVTREEPSREENA